MAQQLEITKILKKAIQIAEIEQSKLSYFIDKRKSSRRHKFYDVHPTLAQVEYLNKLLALAGVKATAKLYNKSTEFVHYKSPYSTNCLVINSQI